MFHSIWSKSLRDYRGAILGWGIGLGLVLAATFATATPDIIAAFLFLAHLLRFFGEPYAIQTAAGFVTFRLTGFTLPVMLTIWAVLAGARLVRGEEERGTLDVLLATPLQRTRLLLEKVAAFVSALILIAVLIGLGAVIGEAKIQQVDVVRAIVAGLNLSLLAFFFGMVALLISQFTVSRSTAAGGASGVLLLTLLVYLSVNVIGGGWAQYLTPFYYYNLDKPLIPSFPDQPLGAILLLGLSALCIVLSLVLFVRRDIGRAAFSWQRKSANGTIQTAHSLSQAERAVSTRSISWHTLFTQRWSSFWWLFGMVIFGIYSLLLALNIQQQFYKIVQDTPVLAQLFFDTPTNTNSAMLGTILFSFMPALVVIFALTLALKWAADLENGRLELILSTPQSRQRVMLERLGATILLILPAPVLTWLTIIIGARIGNVDVSQGRMIAASFMMFPMALITIGLVYALAGRLRYAAVLGLLTVYLALAFLEEMIEGMIQIPAWLMSLSIFHSYGNPIFLGMNWGNFLGMTGVGLVLLVVGLVQFRSADIERG
jgi:ABC-2 type transport system permease protein